MFIASTDDDRTNLVACETAKTLADPFTIARTKSVEYLNTWELTETAFGVDFMVCSDLLTAENIVRVVGLPAAIDVDPFAGGIVQMAEFEIDDASPVAGQTVAEADRFVIVDVRRASFGSDELISHGVIPSSKPVIGRSSSAAPKASRPSRAISLRIRRPAAPTRSLSSAARRSDITPLDCWRNARCRRGSSNGTTIARAFSPRSYRTRS